MKAVKPKRTESQEDFDFKMKKLLADRLADPARYERTTPEHIKRLVENYLRVMKA